MPKLGVIGAMVWDEIHGRDPLATPVEEWGGIAYALAALDATLPADWEIVPLIRVGRDLAPQAGEFLSTLRRVAPSARFIEVPVANQRVILHYESTARRCEKMSGGVPGWKWPELGPMVTDLDAMYVNFISGFEMCLGTSEALRHGFKGPIYADLHSLFLAKSEDGVRTLQPLPNAPTWFSFFDMVQCNEEEFGKLGDDPLVVAASALEAGVSLLNVTLGAQGAVYFAKPGFDGLGERTTQNAERAVTEPPNHRNTDHHPVRTARIAPPLVDVLDPTGCGDVFGSTCFARLLAGDDVVTALSAANAAAARNATFRGASGLAPYLRGELVLA